MTQGRRQAFASALVAKGLREGKRDWASKRHVLVRSIGHGALVLLLDLRPAADALGQGAAGKYELGAVVFQCMTVSTGTSSASRAGRRQGVILTRGFRPTQRLSE
jgi:hypothetical protein